MKKLWSRLAVTLLLLLLVSKPSTTSAYEQSEAPVEYEPKSDILCSEDVMLLAEVMYHENNCNGDYVMLLTGSVVLNRVKSKEFPNTIRNVLFQHGQYSTTKYFGTVHLTRKYYHMAEILLRNGSLAPDNVVFQSMGKQGSGVWFERNGEYFCYR